MVQSHEPVPNAVPSGETFNVLTRFSCPYKVATRDPFNVSQTLTQ